MEKRKINETYRTLFFLLIIMTIGSLAFAAGLAWSTRASAAEAEGKKPKVIYPKSSEVDFEGQKIEGEIRNPGEFYFQRRPEEKFDSLVKPRKNFHREMLRDAVLSK